MTGSSSYLIVGPCAAENREQVLATAEALSRILSVPNEGAEGLFLHAQPKVFFRAGVWKPRTQPGHFEGVGEEALLWLQEVKTTYGFCIATEVATPEHLRLALAHGVDAIWLGARTTTNPFLVQQLADELLQQDVMSRQSLYVFVKNPLSPDVNLWQGALERMAAVVGQDHLVAVHRGFQTTIQTEYRNAPVWSVAFEMKRRLPNVRLIIDPSHLAGDKTKIFNLSQQALHLGYDGLMVETHIHPEQALSDARQQLNPDELSAMLSALQIRQEASDSGLDQLRHLIDETDDALWTLIHKRMQISAEIGEYKRAHDMPVLQSGRFAELSAKRLEWAERNGLSSESVQRILDAIHEESCKWQM